MERLTDRVDRRVAGGEDEVAQAIERLAAYEDAEQDGRLARLPCKIGTRLYHAAALADKVKEYTVDGFEIYETGNYIVLRRYGENKSVPAACLGDSYFFTRKEAEDRQKALKRNTLQAKEA